MKPRTFLDVCWISEFEREKERILLGSVVEITNIFTTTDDGKTFNAHQNKDWILRLSRICIGKRLYCTKDFINFINEKDSKLLQKLFHYVISNKENKIKIQKGNEIPSYFLAMFHCMCQNCTGIIIDEISLNAFESVLMRWMKLEPIIQGEVRQKENHQYSILTHIYGS